MIDERDCNYSEYFTKSHPLAVQLKIRGSHLTWRIANKCLHIREQAKVVERNKRWFPPFSHCPVNRQFDHFA